MEATKEEERWFPLVGRRPRPTTPLNPLPDPPLPSQGDAPPTVSVWSRGGVKPSVVEAVKPEGWTDCDPPQPSRLVSCERADRTHGPLDRALYSLWCGATRLPPKSKKGWGDDEPCA